MANPAGFQMCLPSIRSRNFERIAIAPAAACSQGSSARRSRLRDNPVISGERRSICGRPKRREQAACVASALASASVVANGRAPKSSHAKLTANRAPSATI